MRTSKVVSGLLTQAFTQLEADRVQLADLKLKLQINPADEMVAKQINALRQTITNGNEDLQDLETELKAIVDYENSSAGKAKRQAIQDKLRLTAALADCCVATAHEADAALNAAWRALRRHKAAHTALHEAAAASYGAVQEGSGMDAFGDQAFLVFSWLGLQNTAGPLAEFVLEAFKDYDIQNYIKIEGVTLNNNQHLTLCDITAVGNQRALARLREFAGKCGHEVPDLNDPVLTAGVLAAIKNAEVK